MLKIAIVEDQEKTAQKLAEYVRKYAQEHQAEVELTHFSDGMSIAGEYKPVWDLIFMDIEMPLLDGMSAAKAIRKTDENVILIFITSMAQYAIQGYQVNALDYILKPVVYAQLEFALNKAMAVLKRNEKKFILLQDEETLRRVPADEVLYVEIDNHKLLFVTEKKTYEMRGTMAKAEEMLKGCHFSKCNQCYLVNLRWITDVGKDYLMVSGHRLQISRPRRKAFLQEYSNYLGVEL